MGYGSWMEKLRGTYGRCCRCQSRIWSQDFPTEAEKIYDAIVDKRDKLNRGRNRGRKALQLATAVCKRPLHKEAEALRP